MSQTLVVRTRSLDHEREEPTDPCRRIRAERSRKTAGIGRSGRGHTKPASLPNKPASSRTWPGWGDDARSYHQAFSEGGSPCPYSLPSFPAKGGRRCTVRGALRHLAPMGCMRDCLLVAQPGNSGVVLLARAPRMEMTSCFRRTTAPALVLCWSRRGKSLACSATCWRSCPKGLKS